MTDDQELLRRYAETDSEKAFTELVQRYVNLVHATALRVTNDAHVASDVTQTVFCALARKAATLIHHPALSGWLHRSARYAAINACQQKRRRTQLELDALVMTPPHESAPGSDDAQEIAPVVDELLDRLNERERHAVILRFFEECSFAEIAGRLRIKEDASRMCVARALEKLRASLARRGISSTTGALTVFLTSRAAGAAPAGLAAAASAAALSAPAVLAAGGAPLFVLMAAKIKFVVAAFLVASAGIIFYQERSNREFREKIAASALENETRLVELRERDLTLARLRTELAAAKTVTGVAKASLPVVSPPSPTAPTPAVKLIEQWSNAGRATPAAAFETLFWAAREGRPAEVAALLQITDEDDPALKAIFASLSPSARDRFGTPEFMFVAVALTAPPDSLVSGCEIIDELAAGPDDAVLHYRMAGDSHVRAIPLHRTNGAWTLTVSGLGLPDRQEMWKKMAQSLADDIERRRAKDGGSDGKN
jgi:RNA polymerase sigma factor (sigma-70 family)